MAERYRDARLVAFPSTKKRIKRWSRLEAFSPGDAPEGISVTELPGLRLHECVVEVIDQSEDRRRFHLEHALRLGDGRMLVRVTHSDTFSRLGHAAKHRIGNFAFASL